MAVGGAIEDRTPTEAEYDGWKNATNQWFSDNIRAVYADQANLFTLDTFVGNIETSSYGAGSEYPHAIRQNCFIIFNANSLSDIPPVFEFLSTMSSEFDVTLYIQNYLRNALPADSIFRSVYSVRYTTESTTPAGPINPSTPTPSGGTPTVPAPVPSAPVSPPTTSAPVSAPVPPPTSSAPVPAPVPPPTTSAPIPAPVSAPVSAPVQAALSTMTFPTPPPLGGAPGTATSSFTTEWEMTIGFGIPDRQPRTDEYEGYVAATQSWFEKVFGAAYSDASTGPLYEMLQISLLEASYDASSEPSQSTVLKTDVMFTLGSGQSAPSMNDLIQVLRSASLMDYMLNYLHLSEPHFNIFIGVKAVSWNGDMSMNTPTAPTMPSSPVSAPVPAPMPSSPVAGPMMPSSGTGTGGSADVSTLDSVRIVMTLELAINTDEYPGTRLEPTEAEFNGLLLATQRFLTNSFNDYYAAQPAMEPPIEFVGLQSVGWITTDWSPGEELPYSGEMQFHVSFVDGSPVYPVSDYWAIINDFEFNNYIRSYVWSAMPAGSLFHYTNRVAWNFLNN